MRILVDANTLISLALARGPISTHQHVLELGTLDDDIEVFVAEQTLEEVLYAFANKPTLSERIPLGVAEDFVRQVRERLRVLSKSNVSVERLTQDPKDDYLFGLMISERMDILVTGDKHLQSLTGRYGFLVMSTGETLRFVEELLG